MHTALRLNKYIPHTPTAKQAAFLLLPQIEAFFGGAGGGGKSDALLMAALQYVDIPGYHAILFRRTFTELAKPESLMDRTFAWLSGTDAHWDGVTHSWRFPSGARLVFSHLETQKSVHQHQSAAYQFIGFDELTTFTEWMYRYLFTRLRRLEGVRIPLRMRSASNPGGEGHQWVKQRFIVEGPQHGRPFIPARMADNPYLDAMEYRRSLAEADPVTRLQMEEGDWDASAEGEMFKRHWFRIVADWPRQAHLVRSWDFASTALTPGTDPDWTVGTLMGAFDGQFWIIDMVRDRLSPGEVEALVRQTAARDGPRVDIWLEQEPGSSGKHVAHDYQRRVLVGYAVYPLHTTGSKVERAKPFSSATQAGNVFLVEGAWHSAFFDEVPLFPGGAHDDIVDTLSLAHYGLTHQAWAGTVPLTF